MKCPIDNADLVMSERQGIEIDYCPQCRGVWLDRGELDKIIERAAPAAPQPAPQQVREPARDHQDRSRQEHYSQDRYRQDQYRDGDHHRPRKKREGFLGELFDF